ncbi:MAG: BON domain-containing protein [Polyangiaceae bacterium]
MRHLTLLLIGPLAIAAAACASNNTAPAASSATVAQATDEPNRGPDFAPASNDGLATASGATQRARSTTQPAPNLKPAAEPNANAESKGTWGSGAEGTSGINPTTGNAAAAPADRSSEPGTNADNSRVNRRDSGGATLTPMDQGPSEADRKITRDIRQAVMSDSSLSFTAKNVKIITVDGKVTLRGPVKTAAERSAIEATARKVVGNGALVESQLELIH